MITFKISHLLLRLFLPGTGQSELEEHSLNFRHRGVVGQAWYIATQLVPDIGVKS